MPAMDVSQRRTLLSDTDTEAVEVSESSDETGIQLIAKKNTSLTTTSKPKAKPQATGLQTIDQCVERTKKYSKTSKEHKRLTDAVTNCIVRDVLPIHTVDKAGFRELVAVLNPRYELPYKDYFSRIAIPSLYEEKRENLLHKMHDEILGFSATADLWLSCTSQTIHLFHSPLY